MAAQKWVQYLNPMRPELLRDVKLLLFCSRMSKRTLIHTELIAATPEALFAALHTPRAICEWWDCTSAIVVARTDGYYVVAWGDENDPTYFSVAKITAFEAPRRMVLADYQYYAKDGRMPIDADFVVSFEVTPHASGAKLQIVHDGFPPGSDDFYDGCVQGWADTCAGIQRYMAAAPELLSPDATGIECPES